MKKTYLPLMTMLNWVIRAITIVFIVSSVVLIVESQTQRMSVTVTVDPHRVIIVDKNFTILQIVSNTEEDVRPVVFLDSQDGEEIPYTDSIREQYLYLKPTLNFLQPGIVYDREDRSPMAIIKLVIRIVKKILGVPF